MRVLIVLYDERFGGPQSETLMRAPLLNRLGIETTVAIPLGEDRFLASRLRDAGVECIEFNLMRPRRTLNPAPNVEYLLRFVHNVSLLRRLIRERSVDVMHTNGCMHLQGPIAARLEKIALVWCLNDTQTPWPIRRTALPFIRRLPHRIAPVSYAVARYYFPEDPEQGGRTAVLYPPLDTERFDRSDDGSAIRRELGIAAETPLVGTVANLSPGKGIEYLIDSAAEIKRHFPSVKVLVAGAPLSNRARYARALRVRAERNGISKDVHFLGRRSDVPAILRALDVYIHPSEAEAAPMAVMEASASGRPVVATDIGGTREIVEAGISGFLVPAREPGAIAQYTTRLLAERTLARRMGEAGRKHTHAKFSLPANVTRCATIYESAIRSNASVRLAQLQSAGSRIVEGAESPVRRSSWE